MDGIRRACDLCGSQAELARRVQVTPAAVYQWLNHVRPVPMERCIDIEKATAGAVKCEELRHDIDWAYLRGTHCACPSAAHDEATPA